MASVAYPAVKVLVRFDKGAENAGWLLGEGGLGAVQLGSPDADSDYTDISAYVQSVNVKRGRSRELQRFSPGRCNIRLDNTTRVFDPLNAAGAHYGNLLPGRRVRVSITHPTGGADHRVFTGQVTDWGLSYSSGAKNATTTLSATDRMVDMQRADISKTTTAGTSNIAVNEILNAGGIVSRSIDTGDETFQATAFAAVTCLSAMQTAEDSEQGAMYVDVDNAVVWKSRNSIFSDSASNTSQATLGTASLPLLDVSLDYAADLIRNDVSLTRTGGSAQTAENSDSIVAYGKRSYTKTGLMTSTDAALDAIADTILIVYKDPRVRVQKIVMAPQSNTNLMTQALTRKIRDRVTVQFAPPGGGAVISQDGYIAGIEHNLTPGTYTTTFTLESTEGNDMAFVLGIAKLGTSQLWG
jgi:hypothetical protein